MIDLPLYERIAADLRRKIFDGAYLPGTRLPSIADLKSIYQCTNGTVQRAYRLLAGQGVVITRPGAGTIVADNAHPEATGTSEPIRRANLVNRAEAFLLDSIATGFTPSQVQQALGAAIDRWRAQPKKIPRSQSTRLIRFAGSHDLVLSILPGMVKEVAPDISLELSFVGSLGGLIALAKNECDLAGCHLWDVSTNTYNDPFIARLFPGEQMLVIRLAARSLGLIVTPGNPKAIKSLGDLSRPEVRFANRQPGSGTRVWLDENLKKLSIPPRTLQGYEIVYSTHSDLARAVAENKADAGLGLLTAAQQFGLDFIPLTLEYYDLVAYAGQATEPPLSTFLEWVGSGRMQEKLARLPGYDFTLTGQSRLMDL